MVVHQTILYVTISLEDLRMRYSSAFHGVSPEHGISPVEYRFDMMNLNQQMLIDYKIVLDTIYIFVLIFYNIYLNNANLKYRFKYGVYFQINQN